MHVTYAIDVKVTQEISAILLTDQINSLKELVRNIVSYREAISYENREVWINKSFELNVLRDLLYKKIRLILLAMPKPEEASVYFQQYSTNRDLFELS